MLLISSYNRTYIANVRMNIHRKALTWYHVSLKNCAIRKRVIYALTLFYLGKVHNNMISLCPWHNFKDMASESRQTILGRFIIDLATGMGTKNLHLDTISHVLLSVKK